MFLKSLKGYKNLSECEILWIRTFTSLLVFVTLTYIL